MLSLISSAHPLPQPASSHSIFGNPLPSSPAPVASAQSPVTLVFSPSSPCTAEPIPPPPNPTHSMIAGSILGLYTLSEPVPSPGSTDEDRWDMSQLGTDDALLSPKQSLPRRPSLPKRAVSDFAVGELSVSYRRRRTLANIHGSRPRLNRRPSSSTGPTPEAPACSPPPMVRSVSMPVATRIEFERQRRTLTDELLAPSHTLPDLDADDDGSNTPKASVAWSFAWPEKSASLPSSNSARRPSTYSPLETSSANHPNVLGPLNGGH